MGKNYNIPSDSILRRLQFYFHLLQKTTDNYLFVTDLKYNLVMVSSNMVDDFDLPGEVFTDMDKYWIPLIFSEDLSAYLAAGENMMKPGSDGCHNLQYRIKKRDGEYAWITCRGRLGYDRYSNKPFIFLGTISLLGRKSHADNVTGLLNKYQFEQAVRTALTKYREDGAGGALMVFGLDNFKIVNESYNRNLGDKVLKNIACAIGNVMPVGQRLYKLDGDEFAIVSPNMTESMANDLFSEVQAEMTKITEIDGHRIVCTVSAGTVLYPTAGKDYLVLHKHAEAALSMAKRDGKNRNCIFSKEQFNRWLRSIGLRESIKASLENDFRGFSLFFQPQVDAYSHELIGAEALLRWSHENGKMVSPMEFIPILEETGMILPVGRWVIHEGIRIAKEWQKIKPDFRISVNLSVEQMRDPTLREYAMDCLKQYDMSPESLVLELTESKIVNDWHFVNDQFMEMRKCGVKIAMDDFGTGYSSLACLKNLACDIVKIDRAFITNILQNDFDKRLVQYTIELCHSIGMKCCIEGVETNEEYTFLVDTCKPDSIQGYYFGRPESEDNFVEKFLRKNIVLPE